MNTFALRREQKLGLVLAILGTTLFSFKSVVIKLAYQHGVNAEQVIALRMLISAPIYGLVFVFLQRKKPITLLKIKKQKWLLLFSGLFGYYLASLLDLMGLELISAQLERLILFTYPGFVMLFSWVLWKSLPGNKTIVSMFLTYAGIAVVLGFELQHNSENVLLGGFLVLLSAAFFAAYLILSKKGIAELGSQQFTCIAMLIATTAVGIHMTLFENVALLGLEWAIYFYIFILSIVCTVIPSLLIAAAIGRLGPQKVSILGGLGPVITALFAVTLLNEPFGVSHLLGTGLVIAGVWLIAKDKTT